MYRLSCPSCSRNLNIPDDLKGQNIMCPCCAFVFIDSKHVQPQSAILYLPTDLLVNFIRGKDYLADKARVQLLKWPDKEALLAQLIYHTRRQNEAPDSIRSKFDNEIELHYRCGIYKLVALVAEIGGESVVDLLKSWTRPSNYYATREQATTELGKIRHPTAVRTLLGLISDPPVAGCAVRALGDQGDPEAILPLLKALALGTMEQGMFGDLRKISSEVYHKSVTKIMRTSASRAPDHVILELAAFQGDWTLTPYEGDKHFEAGVSESGSHFGHARRLAMHEAIRRNILPTRISESYDGLLAQLEFLDMEVKEAMLNGDAAQASQLRTQRELLKERLPKY